MCTIEGWVNDSAFFLSNELSRKLVASMFYTVLWHSIKKVEVLMPYKIIGADFH